MDKLLELPEEKILEDLDDIPDMPLQVLKENYKRVALLIEN